MDRVDGLIESSWWPFELTERDLNHAKKENKMRAPLSGPAGSNHAHLPTD